MGFWRLSRVSGCRYPGPALEEAQMELAHVVYRVSTDADYAAQLQSDPESTIEKLGLKLSAEELASLLSILRRDSNREIGFGLRPGSGNRDWW